MPKQNRGRKRQRPPAQSQRPQPPPPQRKTPKALKKGTINLTVFEQEVFREMAVENVRIVESLKQLHNDRQLLEVKQSRICQALGDTHEIECKFSVRMNQAGTAINWDEVKDDGKETPGDGGTEPSGQPDSPPEAAGDDNGAVGAEAEGKTEAKAEADGPAVG